MSQLNPSAIKALSDTYAAAYDNAARCERRVEEAQKRLHDILVVRESAMKEVEELRDTLTNVCGFGDLVITGLEHPPGKMNTCKEICFE